MGADEWHADYAGACRTEVMRMPACAMYLLSVLAKAKGEMSCGHRDSPKFQLPRRILELFFVRKVLAMMSCGVPIRSKAHCSTLRFERTASPMTVAGGPWTHGSVGLSEG